MVTRWTDLDLSTLDDPDPNLYVAVPPVADIVRAVTVGLFGVERLTHDERLTPERAAAVRAKREAASVRGLVETHRHIKAGFAARCRAERDKARVRRQRQIWEELVARVQREGVKVPSPPPPYTLAVLKRDWEYMGRRDLLNPAVDQLDYNLGCCALTSRDAWIAKIEWT